MPRQLPSLGAALLISLLGQATVSAETKCANWDQINLNQTAYDSQPYYISNNTWGSWTSGFRWQCVWNWASNGSTGWGVSSGHVKSESWHQVKGFPSIVRGWHWGQWSANSGFPRRINATNTFRVQASLGQPGSGMYASTLQFYTSGVGYPSNGGGLSSDILICTRLQGMTQGEFFGTGYQQDVSLSGATWKVFKNSIDYDGVQVPTHAFLRTSNTDWTDLDVRQFFQYLVSRGWLNANDYYLGVQQGWEIVASPSGDLKNDYYRVDLN